MVIYWYDMKLGRFVMNNQEYLKAFEANEKEAN